jgi:hypothetical protein
MADVAEETAYSLNAKIPAVALISAGVPFPTGIWIRVADEPTLPVDVEEMLGQLFPALKGMVLHFATLRNAADVEDFERRMQRR